MTMTTDVPSRVARRSFSEFRLDPQVHGTGRVPGQQAAVFDLVAFCQALEERDVTYQMARYAPDAEVQVVDPDNPPTHPQTLHGRDAIQAWLLHALTRDLELHVTHLVDSGARVAFTEHWHHQDGTTVLAMSTAEIEHGLIAMRRTILVWDHDPD
jgi:hypothetical protein